MNQKEKRLIILGAVITFLLLFFISYHVFRLWRFKQCYENGFKYSYCTYYVDY